MNKEQKAGSRIIFRAFKYLIGCKAKYGQNYYDFGEGGLVFTAKSASDLSGLMNL